MFRITATPGAGSDSPRVFHSLEAPIVCDENGPGSRRVLKFVGDPVPRVTRLLPDDVVSIEHAEDGERWMPYTPEPEEEDDPAYAGKEEDDA